MKKLPFKIDRGCLRPASGWVADELRERKYAIGDVVLAVITRARNPQFNRLVHAFGKMLSENIEAFKMLDAHAVLKRLQIESGVACDEMQIVFPGIGPCIYRTPKSMSFESMGQEAFSELFLNLCRYVSEKYWPEMTPEQIGELTEIMAKE